MNWLDFEVKSFVRGITDYQIKVRTIIYHICCLCVQDEAAEVLSSSAAISAV